MGFAEGLGSRVGCWWVGFWGRALMGWVLEEVEVRQFSCCLRALCSHRLFHVLLQDLANLAPRKPDWDLKRDVAKKLEKLEKRTERAIAELIREKLKGNEEDLASAVGAVKPEDYDSE
uniref:Coiled-coil domain containing 12 n=1 Tax=Callorhinchus milii TaxID=7868 RepID=A0A4W3GL79_CALMI